MARLFTRVRCLFSKETPLSRLCCRSINHMRLCKMNIPTWSSGVVFIYEHIAKWYSRSAAAKGRPQIKSRRTLSVLLMFYSTTLFHYPCTAWRNYSTLRRHYCEIFGWLLWLLAAPLLSAELKIPGCRLDWGVGALIMPGRNERDKARGQIYIFPLADENYSCGDS